MEALIKIWKKKIKYWKKIVGVLALKCCKYIIYNINNIIFN